MKCIERLKQIINKYKEVTGKGPNDIIVSPEFYKEFCLEIDSSGRTEVEAIGNTKILVRDVQPIPYMKSLYTVEVQAKDMEVYSEMGKLINDMMNYIPKEVAIGFKSRLENILSR